MARQSKYLIALSKQIEQEQKELAEQRRQRDVAIGEYDAHVNAQEGKVQALVQLRQTLENLGTPRKKKAAPLKAVAAAQS